MSVPSSLMNAKRMSGSQLVCSGLVAVMCFAIVAQAQYNTFDSDSNSDSDGNPILTKSDLGQLVRGSARTNQRLANQQLSAASRSLYNRQNAMQFAPSQSNRRNYGANADSLYGYGGPSAVGGFASNQRGVNSNNDADDDEGSAGMGPNFNANFDNDGENEGSNNEGGAPMNLNQAASGYPNQADQGEGASFGFGGPGDYSSADNSEFGPTDGFAGEGRRAKSASSLMGRGAVGEEDGGAPLYGPNSAVNSGDVDDDGRAGYAPEGAADGDNDDE